MLGIETIAHDIGISKPMVLRLILKGIGHLNTLHTIAASDGVADEFYLALR